MFELLECCRQCDCTSIRVHISLPWSVYPRVFTVMSVIHTQGKSMSLVFGTILFYFLYTDDLSWTQNLICTYQFPPLGSKAISALL